MNADEPLMNRFLEAVRGGRILVSVQLSGGETASGTLLDFDGSALLLSSGGRQLLVPLAAVVTVTPARPIPGLESGV